DPRNAIQRRCRAEVRHRHAREVGLRRGDGTVDAMEPTTFNANRYLVSVGVSLIALLALVAVPVVLLSFDATRPAGLAALAAAAALTYPASRFTAQRSVLHHDDPWERHELRGLFALPLLIGLLAAGTTYLGPGVGAAMFFVATLTGLVVWCWGLGRIQPA